MEKYNLEGQNPFGLPVQIFTNLNNISKEFQEKWEAMLVECSKLIMATLIEDREIRTLSLEGVKWQGMRRFKEKKSIS